MLACADPVSRRFHRGVLRFAGVVSTAWGVSAGAADDFLPQIPQGDIEVELRSFVSGLSGSFAGTSQVFPTKMVALPDGSGRNLISTFGGLLRLVDDSGAFLDAPVGGPYLNTNTNQTDIAPFAYGLTSVAVHPDFATADAPGFGKIYALVTEDAKGDPNDYDFRPVVGNVNQHAAVLVEYALNPAAIGSNRLITSGPNQNVSRRELFVAQEPDNEHNFGDLAFDDQGRLYISAGDGLFNFNGGVNPEAQNAAELGTVLGKILRIDPTGSDSANGQYGIVADNVFAADGDPGTLGEVFSYGHRNPWRLSVDPVTGAVVVGEVGHFNIEEVNVSTNGGNFGWPTLEGTFSVDQNNAFLLTPDADSNNNGIGDIAEANGFTEPVFQYDHQDGKSVTGGFVYRGTDIPDLIGKYVFADFEGGDGETGGGSVGPRLFYGDLDTGEFFQLQIDPGGRSLPGGPISFSEDADHELYVVFLNGEVLRLTSDAILGDYNGSGLVEQGDLDLVLSNWGVDTDAAGVPSGWIVDLPDGLIEQTELDGVLSNWGAAAAPDVGTADVPEPAGVFLLLASAVAGSRRRR